MNSDLKMKLLTEICERNPNTRLNSALWQVARKEKVEALRLPRPDRRNLFQRIVARFTEPGAY
jgi:hypothetical protein